MCLKPPAHAPFPRAIRSSASSSIHNLECRERLTAVISQGSCRVRSCSGGRDAGRREAERVSGLVGPPGGFFAGFGDSPGDFAQFRVRFLRGFHSVSRACWAESRWRSIKIPTASPITCRLAIPRFRSATFSACAMAIAARAANTGTTSSAAASKAAGRLAYKVSTAARRCDGSAQGSSERTPHPRPARRTRPTADSVARSATRSVSSSSTTSPVGPTPRPAGCHPTPRADHPPPPGSASGPR